MSFLQPILLIALPLTLLPIVIHLIHRHRHRTVRWAAMMFLLDARKMTKGMARLRQILILAMRVLAVAALIFAAGRPLAGGWLALAGGKADTVILLLDRSASMEQHDLETGASKRSTALARLTDLLGKTGRGSEVVLIDSATLEPTPIPDPDALGDLPRTAPTATSADVPGLLQAAVDYLSVHESGRTDIWLASDLRQSDWKPGSGAWQSIRTELAASETVRLFLLTFPDPAETNLAVTVDEVKRRRSADGRQLVMDLAIRRPGSGTPGSDDSGTGERERTVPVEFTVNGTRTVERMTMTGDELVRLGHTISLGPEVERGWGRVDLPADDNPADNSAFFVFDEPATRTTAIVSDDRTVAEAIRAAAASPVDPSVSHEVTVVGADGAARVPWDETALVFWHAPLPAEDSTEATLLRQHVERGRGLVLLPPRDEPGGELFGVRWREWRESESDPLAIGWWRTESGLLADTRSGAPLPVGEVDIHRTRRFEGEGQPLLELEGGEAVATRLVDASDPGGGAVHVWGTLPKADHSNLATEGVVFFVMIHRALAEGAEAVSRARSRPAAVDALPDDLPVSPLSTTADEDPLTDEGLRAGAYEVAPQSDDPRLVALNRPDSEDDPRSVDPAALDTLLQGVDYRRITDTVSRDDSLASEVWRAFLVAMALALLVEAALCLPPRPARQPEGPHLTT